MTPLSGHIHHRTDDLGRIHLDAVGAITIEPDGLLHTLLIVVTTRDGEQHSVAYSLRGLALEAECIDPLDPPVELLTTPPVRLVGGESS